MWTICRIVFVAGYVVLNTSPGWTWQKRGTLPMRWAYPLMSSLRCTSISAGRGLRAFSCASAAEPAYFSSVCRMVSKLSALFTHSGLHLVGNGWPAVISASVRRGWQNTGAWQWGLRARYRALPDKSSVLCFFWNRWSLELFLFRFVWHIIGKRLSFCLQYGGSKRYLRFS